MRALFIGGTGLISCEISKRCVEMGMELTLLNRGGNPALVPEGARVITADIEREADVREKLSGMCFDAVADFIVYDEKQAARDVRLFSGITKQYIFISSASVYQKPPSSPFITESTPLCNPFWEYSRNKIACEELFAREYRENGFPITIVRPSHTYGDLRVPVALQGKKGSFQAVERIRLGKKVIIPGDGAGLWTMTHNTDFAKGFTGLMGNIHAIGQAYHITSDESLTWNQIYGCIADALGVRLNPVYIPSTVLAGLCEDYRGGLLGDKSVSVVFDNVKIKRAVPDFVATTRFDEGVRKAIDYLYADAERQIPDPEFDAWCDAVIDEYESAVRRLPAYGLISV